MTDHSLFPDPDYRDTVLAPLFEGVKKHHIPSFSSINRAHLVMLDRTGILPSDIAKYIAEALVDIDSRYKPASLKYTGEYEDYFFWVEAQLKKLIGADVGGMLHTARSRNDMDHTVFKMALRERLDVILGQCLSLADVIIDKAEKEKTTIIVAYTHGQPAQPSTFGHYLAAALEVLISDISRLQAARDALDLCPMGAAAITTTGFPIDRKMMAKLLGFSEPKRNSYGCIASVDYITGLYSAMKLLFLHLGRFIQDMAFWSAFEVGQLYVPNSLVQVSSIMPQKRNPVPIEHMRHLCSVSAGRCDMIINSMHNTPFTDMNDSEGEVQEAGYAAFDSGGRVLTLLSAFINSVSINAERVKHNSDAACITITELADTLVREEALSFRQAHEVSAITAKDVIEQGITLGQAYNIYLEAFESVTERPSQLEEHKYRSSVSLEYFVTTRNCYGGPGPESMDSAFSHYRELLADFTNCHEESTEQLQLANRELKGSFQALLES